MSSTFTNNTTAISPLLVTQYQAARSTRHLVHDVLGSNVPDVTLQDAGPRTGSMTVLLDNETDAQALFDLLGGNSVLDFTNTDTRDRNMTFVAFGTITIQQDDQNRRYWTVAFGFLEVIA